MCQLNTMLSPLMPFQQNIDTAREFENISFQISNTARQIVFKYCWTQTYFYRYEISSRCLKKFICGYKGN